ncbi:MAG: coenzyme F420-0:L-glutamate ligase [Candidatus Hadarchaeales archaeon]
MQLIPLKLKLLHRGGDLVKQLLDAAKEQGGLKSQDVLVIASKAIATVNAEMVKLADVKPSKKALAMAKKTGQPPSLVEVVLREADVVLGMAKGAILTIKNGILCANAGVDRSNVPKGFAALMPREPDREAEKIRMEIFKRTGVKVGVVIADSNVKPLRLGTVGQAIGVAGMEPVVDRRGDLDLFGKPLKITFQALGDQLATAAQLLFGEGAERVPAVIVRGLRVKRTGGRSPKISPKKDLYKSVLKYRVAKNSGLRSFRRR